MDVGGEELDTLFRAHFERIARVIGRVIHDQARAEELAVEVFLRWNQKQTVRDPLAEGWLYRTAIRQALDELRRVRRQNRFERLLAPFRQAPQTPEQLYEAEVQDSALKLRRDCDGRQQYKHRSLPLLQ